MAGVWVGENKKDKKISCIKHPNSRRLLDRVMWKSCGKLLGWLAAPVQSHVLITREGQERHVLVPAQPRTAMSLPLLTPLAQRHCQKSPGPHSQSFLPAGLHFHLP